VNGVLQGKSELQIFICISNSSKSRPQDSKELYNLRHSQARNVIERIFGIFKRRFKLLTSTPEYSIETQAKIVQGLAVIHNFIRIFDPQDILEETDDLNTHPISFDSNELGKNITQSERTRASDRRDAIAEAMWAGYQRRIQSSRM
jgi:hypothetical protein